MLGGHDVGATLAVDDFDVAKSFYEGTLGLAPVMEMGDSAVYQAGNSRLLVYVSEFAGTNQATAATWAVGDQLDAVVEALLTPFPPVRGVAFEHYDLPDTEREGDVHVMGEMRGAWFKDPAGNIIGLINQTV